jgi:arylsulfatase
MMSDLSRRSFLQAGSTAAAASHPGASTSRPPNVLFVMSDQLRADCLGANGNRLIRTPRLDRLAAESANMTNAFVQAPVCVPSRISFFTGRYPHSHKNRVNYTPCDRREVFLQQLLRQAGYQTGSVGKLHFYPPTAEHARSTGFDEVLLDDGVPKTDPYSDYVKWRNRHDPQAKVHYDTTVRERGADKNPYRAVIDYEYTPTAWVGAQACAMLRRFTASAKPFFLFASFFKPHSPHTVPAPFDSMYNQVDIPRPRPVSMEYLRTLPKPVQAQILRGKGEYRMEDMPLQWVWRSYYGGVSMVDQEVGRILDELEKCGQARNTIVIFTSDHGDQLMEHGLQGKNVFFEESVHVPLLLRYPGQIPPGRHEPLIETVDLLPTVFDLCGIPVPEYCQGRTFSGLIHSQRGEYQPREFVFAENIIPEVITGGQLDLPFVSGKGVGGILHPDAKMIRTRKWKLNYCQGGPGELYDLEKDPREYRNLYSDPVCQNVLLDLKGCLLDFLIQADENDQIARHWLV